MHHFVYRTTNLINSKEYIGVHSTDDINDGYLGSGLAIRRAIALYGTNNFVRKILSEFKTREEANSYEAELVTLDYVILNNNYNIIPGGGNVGGLLKGKTYIGIYGEEKAGKLIEKKREAGRKEPRSDETKQKIKESISRNGGRAGEKNPMFNKRGRNCPNFGKKHTLETIEKIRAAHQGRNFSEAHKQNIGKSSASSYLLISPCGEEIILESWKHEVIPFCGFRNMSQAHLKNFINKGIIPMCSNPIRYPRAASCAGWSIQIQNSRNRKIVSFHPTIA